MENNNYKIDFEEKFKTNDDDHNFGYVNHSNKDKSLLTIILYAFLFFLGGAALIATMFFKPPSNSYLVLESFDLYDSEYLIAVINKDDYLKEKDKFKLNDFVYDLTNDYILISKNDNDEFINNNYLDILNGSVNKWPDSDENNIYIILSDDDSEIVSNIKDDNLITITPNFSIFQNGIIMFIAYVIVAIPLIFINKEKLLIDIQGFIKDERKPAIGSLAYSFATMFAVTIGLGIVTNILIQIFGFKTDSANQESIVLMLNSNAFIFIAITTVLIGPLVEELVFREGIFGLIKNEKIAIAVSALSFGSIHIISEVIELVGQFSFYSFLEVIVTSIPYIGMGVAFSVLYMKNNRNVFLLYLVHALLNLMSVITIFL